jgi:hypothetical protein
MSIKIYMTVLIIVAFCFQGCIPAPRIVTPTVSGKVTDKDTKIPITNASVYFKEYPENTSITDSFGQYHLEKNIGLGAWIPVGDPMPPRGTLIVKKTGYSDYAVVASLRFGEFPRDKPIKLDIELDCNEVPKQHSENNQQVLIDKLATTGNGNTEEKALKAHSELLELGINAFDTLVANINDSRPSYDNFSGDVIRRTPTTVGEVCFDIISIQIERYSYHKSLPNYFDHFNGQCTDDGINRKNIAQWWAKNKDKTLKELQIDAVEGTILKLKAEEKPSEFDKKRIEYLSSKLAELKKL